MLYGPRGDAHPIKPMDLSVVSIGARRVLVSTGDIPDYGVRCPLVRPNGPERQTGISSASDPKRTSC